MAKDKIEIIKIYIIMAIDTLGVVLHRVELNSTLL